MKQVTFFSLFLLMAGIVSGQTGSPSTNSDVPTCKPQSSVLNGAYKRENTPNRRVTPYTPLREADVMWSKRIWRRIDLKEKFNQKLYYPLQPTNDRISLFDAMVCSIDKGNLTAYNPGTLGDDDSFTTEYTAKEIRDVLYEVDTQYVIDPDTGDEIAVPIETRTESSDIRHYVVKEDWFFDKQRSVMDVRIIGIAPVKIVYDSDGDFKGYQILFWVYYPQARHLLSNVDAYNTQNDTERRTFEDVFAKRMFHSTIIKESNVYDRNINEYKKGMNALLEGEGINEKVRNMESDMWSY